MSQIAYRLGIDTGGTYTDAVLVDENQHIVAAVKCLTTRVPTHPAQRPVLHRVNRIDGTLAWITLHDIARLGATPAGDANVNRVDVELESRRAEPAVVFAR